MKTIIYAGIALFSAASVYGVADYYNSQKKGTFNKLYKEEEVLPLKQENNTRPVSTTGNPIVENNEATFTKKKEIPEKINKRARRTIRLEEYSRGKIIEPLRDEQEVSVKNRGLRSK